MNSKTRLIPDALRRALMAGAGAATLAWLGAPRAQTRQLAEPALLKYRDTPHHGMSCASCWAWIPGPTAARGRCKAVRGAVLPTGWCMAYAPRRRDAAGR